MEAAKRAGKIAYFVLDKLVIRDRPNVENSEVIYFLLLFSSFFFFFNFVFLLIKNVCLSGIFISL